MSISYIQDAGNSAGTASITTDISAAGSGNCLVAWMRFGGTGGYVTITLSDNGSPASTWKQVGNPFYDDGNDVLVACFVALNVVGGPTQITGSVGSAAGSDLQIIEFSGVGYVDIPGWGFDNGDFGGSSVTTLPVVPFNANCAILGFLDFVGGFPTISVSNGGASSATWNLLSGNGGGGAARTAGAYAIVTTNGTYAPTFSWSGSYETQSWTIALGASSANPWSFIGNANATFAYPSSSSGQSLTFPYNCVAGSLLLAYVTAYTGTASNTAVSDPTNGTWNYIANTSGGYGNISAYWVVNTSTSALTVSWAGSLTYPGFLIAEFLGNAASPFDASATNDDSDTQSVAVNFPNDLVVGYPVPPSAQVLQAGAGWNTTGLFAAWSPIIYNVSSSAASPLFNNTGGIVAVSFKVPAVPLPFPPLLPNQEMKSPYPHVLVRM